MNNFYNDSSWIILYKQVTEKHYTTVRIMLHHHESNQMTPEMRQVF